MRNLGITRNENQLTLLREKAFEKDINIISLPLTEITSLIVGAEQLPNLAPISWLFFTSANGAHSFLSHCKKDYLPKSLKIASVGEKTSKAIQSYGLDVHFVPSQAYGKQLFQEFLQLYAKQDMHILYLRAEHVHSNPRDIFDGSLIKYNELITYKSQEKQINKSEIDKFSDNDYILFTAPSTVSSYNNQFGTPIAKLIAIGNTTKEAIDKNNWTTDFTLSKPEIESVLEQI